MTQLCLGDRDVQDWIIGKLCAVIERYGLEWLKWDPSGTVTHACDRSDHGHAADGGAWAAFEGRRRILDELLRRFPGLSGFECDPSLRHCRLNPGGRTWLPGGYMCEFMTGPMVGPYVWGSLATVRTTDMTEIRHLTSGWCTASTLDYSLRLHFMRGFTFGNINGMTSQLLSRAPAGYVEAFKRNLLAFKSYRHLLLQDVWHPALASPQDWGALLYAAEGATEAVLFAFRHPGGAQKNVLKLTGLDPAKSYVLTSLNDRPGRERRMAGAALVSEGLALSLPDPWLAKGDGFPGDQYNDQLEFGSDVILIREALA
jgi:alpha-galactosidase